MKTAACYLRVSTDRQTVESQRQAVEQLARARGFVPFWYEEQESAAKRRPVLEKLVSDVRRGQHGAVCVWAMDRLHRSMQSAIGLVLELDRLRVPLLSVSEGWLDLEGPVRPLLVAVFGWVAEQERNRLRERTRAGIDRARRQGVQLGRPPVVADALEVAVRARLAGQSLRAAAALGGVSEATLRRRLAAGTGPDSRQAGRGRG